MREVYSNFDDVTRLMKRRTSTRIIKLMRYFCDCLSFFLFAVLFLFSLLLLLLLFLRASLTTRCVKTALLSLSLSPLSKKVKKEHEKIVHETLILRKKN